MKTNSPHQSYVGTLDLAKLGFRRGVGAGQPPHNPADLLKLYLYGYLNQVRSSRRLEREASRNLVGALVPIHGAFFHGDASKASIATKRLADQLAVLEFQSYAPQGSCQPFRCFYFAS